MVPEKEMEQKYLAITEENKRLQVTIEELSVLNDIATAISSSQSVERIQRLIIKKLIKHLGVEEGIVMLLSDFEAARPFRTMMRTQNSSLPQSSNKLDEEIMGWMLSNKVPLLINNFNADERFDIKINDELPIRSLLCAPMIIKSKMIGLIALFNKVQGDFSSEDQRLLSICAMQSAQVIENARLYLQEQVLNKMKEEMNLARQIQQNLLPRNNLVIDNYKIIGNMIPAKEVGGDFYDFIPSSDNKIAIWLGDISGKGITAALLMANLEGILRSRSLIDHSCSECLENANRILCSSIESDKFATLVYSILDPVKNELVFVSAGHTNLILLRRDGTFQLFESEDVPLGILDDYKYSEFTIHLEPGDSLIIYSDGITEAENKKEELFGEKRLMELVSKNSLMEPENMLEEIYNTVQKYSEGTLQSDDQTAVIIRRE